MDSILQYEKVCYISGAAGILHRHHCIGGSNRQMAEKERLWVYLTPEWHMKAHNDTALKKYLQGIAQAEWLRKNENDRKKWMALFGRNYLA
jgi:hypothetical protein